MLRNLEAAYSLELKEKPPVFEFKDTGEIVQDKLEAFGQQLALSLLKHDFEHLKESESESKNMDIVTKKQMPSSLLSTLHLNLVKAYSEVEVMHDILQKIIQTRARVDSLPQQMSLCPTVPSQQPGSETATLKHRAVAVNVKKQEYKKITSALRKRSVELSSVLDKDDTIFTSDAFKLQEAGWPLCRSKGQLAVRYGLNDDHAMLLTDCEIQENHRNMVLCVDWEFTNDNTRKRYANLTSTVIHEQSDEDDAMDVDSSNDRLKELIKSLESAKSSVLDEVIYFHLLADARTIRLATIKDKQVIYPISSAITLVFSMKKREDYTRTVLHEWTQSVCRKTYIEQMKEQMKRSTIGIYKMDLHPVDPISPILYSVAQSCKLLHDWIDVKAILDETSFESVACKLCDIPLPLSSKSIRVDWLNKDGVNIARMTRFKNSGQWQVALKSKETWEIINIPLPSQEVIQYISLIWELE